MALGGGGCKQGSGGGGGNSCGMQVPCEQTVWGAPVCRLYLFGAIHTREGAPADADAFYTFATPTAPLRTLRCRRLACRLARRSGRRDGEKQGRERHEREKLRTYRAAAWG